MLGGPDDGGMGVTVTGPDGSLRASGRWRTYTDRPRAGRGLASRGAPTGVGAVAGPGTVLGSLADQFDPARARPIWTRPRPLPLYAERCAHPGWLLRFANAALSRNVELGPWIHVASEITLLGVVGAGDAVTSGLRFSTSRSTRGTASSRSTWPARRRRRRAPHRSHRDPHPRRAD